MNWSIAAAVPRSIVCVENQYFEWDGHFSYILAMITMVCYNLIRKHAQKMRMISCKYIGHLSDAN